jgi:hypothetical protein
VFLGTTGECAANASVLFVGVCLNRDCRVVHDRSGPCFGHCSLGRRGLSRPLSWRASRVRALLWPVFARSAWAQAATVLASTTCEGAVLSCFRSVDVGSASHCGGEHVR